MGQSNRRWRPRGHREARSNRADARASSPHEQRLCGVGMSLGPKDPGPFHYLHVRLVKEGGPLAAARKARA
eukprot:497070-Rhodomonas_salina.1